MTLNYLLPGSVFFLKALLKLAIDRRVSALLVVKLILALPVDLIFLLLSYFVTYCVDEGFESVHYSTGDIATLLVSMVILCTLATILASVSERAMDAANPWGMAFCSLCAYICFISSGFIVWEVTNA